MAEFVMKDLVKKAGLEKDFYIESAATSDEELGNSVYPPARRKLKEHGLDCDGKSARQITASDYDRFDYIVAMDKMNIRNISYIIKSDPEHKISLLMDYTSTKRDVADPWFTGDFDVTWDDVSRGCSGLLKKICSNGV
jgi:protein-tyrosine phosphatase